MKYYNIQISDRDDDWAPISLLFVIEAENSYSAWFKLINQIKRVEFNLEFDSHMEISYEGLYMDEKDSRESAEKNIKSMYAGIEVTFIS